MTEPNGASSQSLPPDGNDAGTIENHENTKADDTEDTATVTGREQDFSNAVAMDVQTVKANNQDPPLDSQAVPELKKQPDTRPISQKQLVAEVKGIYAGLVLVESKCIELDANLAEEAGAAPADSGKDTVDTGLDTDALTKETKSESERKPETELPEFRQLGDQSLYKKIGNEYWVLIDSQWVPSLDAEQYAALMAPHRTLLHDHHDFFLASQHPSGSVALERLPAKYDMPARMWRHGIHSFLEVMRKRHVESAEHMACFIILAYEMVTSLEETVPRFRDTWIECKADLARYG